MEYVQLKFSRTEGRTWDTGVAGLGKIKEARDMCRNLYASCDYIEVIVEEREGSTTLSSVRHLWSRKTGWK